MHFRKGGPHLVLNLDKVIEGERIETDRGQVLRVALESGHTRDLVGEEAEAIWKCLLALAGAGWTDLGGLPSQLTGGEGSETAHPCDPPHLNEAGNGSA